MPYCTVATVRLIDVCVCAQWQYSTTRGRSRAAVAASRDPTASPWAHVRLSIIGSAAAAAAAAAASGALSTTHLCVCVSVCLSQWCWICLMPTRCPCTTFARARRCRRCTSGPSTAEAHAKTPILTKRFLFLLTSNISKHPISLFCEDGKNVRCS